MIVHDDHVMAALAYLGDTEIHARVSYNSTTTENAAKIILARLYLSYKGTIDERKAQATCNPEYMEALDRAAEAERDLVKHEAQVLNAKMVIEIWRTENANARAMERIR